MILKDSFFIINKSWQWCQSNFCGVLAHSNIILWYLWKSDCPHWWDNLRLYNNDGGRVKLLQSCSSCVYIKLWNQMWQTCIPCFILPSLDTQVFLHCLFYVGMSCSLHQSPAQKVLLTVAQTAVLDQSFSVKAREHSMPVRWPFPWAANSQRSAMVSLNSVGHCV